jgi:Zn-dependent protease with chaperone function
MRRLARGLVVGAMLAFLWHGAALASVGRPNALDRRVDALTKVELMTEPARALVDPDRQAAATRRVHWTLLGWFLTSLFEAAALLYLWSSGRAAALRDRLRRRMRSEWGVRFLFGAELALVARVAALLPAFYLYRVDRILELTTDLTRVWALWWLYHTVVGMIVAGVIASVVLWLAERTHQWYAYTILAILAASVGWAYASPYIESSRASVRLAVPGVPNVPVFVAGSGLALGDAAVLGAGPTRRIVLSPGFVAGATEPEIEYRVAYELGRVLHGDLLSIALIEGGVIIVFAAIAIVIADRVRFRRDDDPLSRLAIVGALFALVYLAAVPVRNAALRSYVFDADRYAVAMTGDPSAAIRALVRASDQNMEEVCPEAAATLFLYTEPGAGARVSEINRVPSGCNY